MYTISFNEDGTIQSLYNEKLTLEELGNINIKRASYVEPENDLWYVKKLLKAEIEIYNILNRGGIESIAYNMIIQEDLEKYGLTLEDLYKEENYE